MTSRPLYAMRIHLGASPAKRCAKYLAKRKKKFSSEMKNGNRHFTRPRSRTREGERARRMHKWKGALYRLATFEYASRRWCYAESPSTELRHFIAWRMDGDVLLFWLNARKDQWMAGWNNASGEKLPKVLHKMRETDRRSVSETYSLHRRSLFRLDERKLACLACILNCDLISWFETWRTGMRQTDIE